MITTIEPTPFELLNHGSISIPMVDTESPTLMEPFQIPNEDVVNRTRAAGKGTTQQHREIHNGRANIVIMQLTTTTLLASVSSGLINVCIPRMAVDLDVTQQQYFW